MFCNKASHILFQGDEPAQSGCRVTCSFRKKPTISGKKAIVDTGTRLPRRKQPTVLENLEMSWTLPSSNAATKTCQLPTCTVQAHQMLVQTPTRGPFKRYACMLSMRNKGNASCYNPASCFRLPSTSLSCAHAVPKRLTFHCHNPYYDNRTAKMHLRPTPHQQSSMAAAYSPSPPANYW